MTNPTRFRSATQAFVLAAPLAFTTAFWLVLVQVSESGSHHQPSFLVHWLGAATLALPAVVVAAWLGVRLGRRLLGHDREFFGRIAVSAVVGVSTSIAVALATAIQARLFAAHDGLALPLPLVVLRNALVALPVALVVATIVGVVVLRERPSRRSVRRTVLRPAHVAVGAAVLAAAAALGGSAVEAAGVDPGAPCAPGATVKYFYVQAIDVDITLNRFGDHDPKGKMYVGATTAARLSAQLARVRAEEIAPLPRVSSGLHGDQGGADPIQPLVLRANEGDCVKINFTNNASGGDYGMHIDGISFGIGSSGDAIGNNPSSAVPRGVTRDYVFSVPNSPLAEGAHYVHPGPGNRDTVSHGLFGALVAEPRGSTYFDPVDRDGDTTPGDVSCADGQLLPSNQVAGGQLRLCPADSGEEAIVHVPDASCAPASAPCDFRDNVTMFHEIGNEKSDLFNARGDKIPTVDPTTDSYRPDSRGINYRSEPFMDRLSRDPDLNRQLGLDKTLKSLAYDSYTFGDPATPITRAYVHDPMKIRFLHAGTEMFHVYHLHGGGLRWPLNPRIAGSGGTPGAAGFDWADTHQEKHPTQFSTSQQLDSQAAGPGESYTFELAGGAGGLQGTPGDLTYHCHIAEHYVSGMWGIRRAFETVQPTVQPLPNRQLPPPPAPVESSQLVGRTIQQFYPDAPGGPAVAHAVTITKANLDAWIRPQLPPQGVPRDARDASVWNWSVLNPGTDQATFVGEPEDTAGQDWPDMTREVAGHPSLFAVNATHLKSVSGSGTTVSRPAILFNPNTGRPAYPLTLPHIGKRPPFSPNGHSGAPFLGEDGDAAPDPTLPVDPWAGRPDGICAAKTAAGTPTPHPAPFNVVAVEATVQVTKNPDRFDPEGKLLTLARDEDAVVHDPQLAQPLAIRANVGDCVALTLTSEQTDAAAANGFAKTNLHVHHVQFDPTGSDGAVVGFNYEMSIRPFKAPDTMDTTLAAAASAGDFTINVTDSTRFRPGIWIGIGLSTEYLEPRQIASISGSAVTLTKPLLSNHGAGDWAGVEFARSRWYIDTALDNIFFHDHVDGIHGWPHGAVGMIVVEPPGSTYHDPRTGDLVRSGTLVDIHAPTGSDCTSVYPSVHGTRACSLVPGLVDGSFREFVLWLIDGNETTGIDSTFNLRAAPFIDRGTDPSRRFVSRSADDPFTTGGVAGQDKIPAFQAYTGDPVVLRTINVSPNVETLHFDGQRVFVENRCMGASPTQPACEPALNSGRGDNTSRWQTNLSSRIDTIHYGVSERYTVILDGGAGGPAHVPGDYVFMNGLGRRLHDGAWGMLSVRSQVDASSLKPLPGHGTPAQEVGVCPVLAPSAVFSISAVDASSIQGSGDGLKAAFVPSNQAAAVRSGALKPSPLVLHVAAGSCVSVHFKNERKSARASFDVAELLHGSDSRGVNVGGNAGDQTVAVGGSRDYRFFADTAKIGSASISDFGADLSAKDGLYGTVVVAPPGATFSSAVGEQVDVHCASSCRVDGKDVSDYRDLTVVILDDDAQIGNDFMPYPTAAEGPAFINSRTAPLANDANGAFSANDPGTPILTATAGQPLEVHALVAPESEQMHVFSLGGLSWSLDRQIENSAWLTQRGFGPWETIDADVVGGAGGLYTGRGDGAAGVAFDYFYGDLRRPFTQAGTWGVLRVRVP